MWDTATAERYETWYKSPRGSFALGREQRLLADVVSPWQRRSQTLLEIGCGAGHFLELFYNGGFDVTGIDNSEAMLEKARERMGNKATLRVGQASHLPFDDGEFDYVAMVTALECMYGDEEALNEAFRVAKRGIVIMYLNAWSLYSLEQKYKFFRLSLQERSAKKKVEDDRYSLPEPERKHILQKTRWLNILEICRMVRKASGKFPNVYHSTLFSPSFLWRGNKPFSLSWWHLLPFGAVSVVRVDLMPVSPTTMNIRTPNVARTARGSAGVVTMDRYPKSKEK
jgi:ubiquinone/menaquinone biosynthesis C-methylase UbiE